MELPFELLVDILEYLSSPKDLGSMMTTCWTLYQFPRIHVMKNLKIYSSIKRALNKEYKEKFKMLDLSYNPTLGIRCKTNDNTSASGDKILYACIVYRPIGGYARFRSRNIANFITNESNPKPQKYYYSSGKNCRYGFLEKESYCPRCMYRWCKTIWDGSNNHRVCIACEKEIYESKRLQLPKLCGK